MIDRSFERAVGDLLVDMAPSSVPAGLRKIVLDGVRRTPQRRPLVVIGGKPWTRRTTLLVAALVPAVLTASGLLGSGMRGPEPALNVTAPTATAATERGCASDVRTAVVTRWTGRIRSDLAGMPSVCRQVVTDPLDASEAGIDIVEVAYGSETRWTINLADFPTPARTLDRADVIIEYGLVFETTGDDVPDYLIAINNDALVAGEFRTWLTRIEMGTTEEQVGGPYGFPFDFSHPDEQVAPGDDPISPHMTFFFLGAPPWGGSGGPATYIPGEGVRMYAWASVTRRGEVVAWDYAPDVGWLRAP